MIRKNNLLIFFLVFIPICGFSQERLLTKKIIYEVEIMKPRIESTKTKDSIIYDYVIDKRFWWQSIDAVMAQIKSRKMHFETFTRDTLNFDTIMKNLKTEYNKSHKKQIEDKDLQKLIEEEIRVIKFEEEWTYNPATMLVNKKVIGYNPVIARDSVMLQDIDKANTDLAPKQYFRFELGWIYPKQMPSFNKDTLCVARNIHYTIPIYNKKPYYWWENNLEPENSIPYFDMFIQKAENGSITVYPEPSSTEAYTKSDVAKRRQYDMTVAVVVDSGESTSEKDEIVKGTYNTDNIDHLRFGDEWFFDLRTYQFIKQPNYVCPMIDIIGFDGTSRGLMPLYYLRRR